MKYPGLNVTKHLTSQFAALSSLQYVQPKTDFGWTRNKLERSYSWSELKLLGNSAGTKDSYCSIYYHTPD